MGILTYSKEGTDSTALLRSIFNSLSDEGVFIVNREFCKSKIEYFCNKKEMVLLGGNFDYVVDLPKSRICIIAKRKSVVGKKLFFIIKRFIPGKLFELSPEDESNLFDSFRIK